MTRLWFATIVCVIGLGLIIQANIARAALEDILYEKGQITKEEWLKAKADQEKAAEPTNAMAEWQKKVSQFPILSDKFNIGVNALQAQFFSQDAHVTEGSPQDQFLIRRAELITWGKLMEQIPRWHILFDFGSLGTLNSNTRVCTDAACTTTANVISAADNQILKEAYIDIRPVLSWAPYLDIIRVGQYRIPFGIENDTSSGVIDFISRAYFSSGASGGGSVSTGIDFLQERDIYIDIKSKPHEFIELDAVVMNGNFIDYTKIDNNSQKDYLGRIRIKPRKDFFVSFSGMTGESENRNTALNGRGKGRYDRLGTDFRYTPDWLPGLHLQGEWITGHDAPNQAKVGDTSFTTNGIGVMRRTWYVYAKYRLDNLGVDWLKGWEPIVRYEEFDPNTSVGKDMFTRTTVGINYYFAEVLPKIQTKLQLNYEFRHHQESTPLIDPTFDAAAKNAFLIQFQVRWM
jgi:phosphate-selective porin O/P